MRGHLVKRGKGSWSIVVDVGRDEHGKRKQQWLTRKGTRKQAEQKLAEVLHQLDIGSYVQPAKLTVGEYLEQWIEGYASTNVSPRTCERYAEIIRQHLIPAFGRIALTDLKPSRIQAYYAKALREGRKDGRGGLSAQTVTHHHRVLHTALEVAVKQGILGRNPASSCTPPRPQHKEMLTFNQEEIGIFLDAARQTQHYALYYTAVFSGLRRSELLALKWGNIDLEMCSLSIVETLHRLKNGDFITKEPKSQRGRRLISLPPSLAITLREHRVQQQALRETFGLPLTPNDLVFSQIDGSPIPPDRISHEFRRVARKIGVHGLSFNCLRHTHATLMLRQNIHPKIVSERLGHSSVSVTLDRYSHVTAGLQEAAALAFDVSLEGSIKRYPVSNPLATPGVRIEKP